MLTSSFTLEDREVNSKQLLEDIILWATFAWSERIQSCDRHHSHTVEWEWDTCWWMGQAWENISLTAQSPGRITGQHSDWGFSEKITRLRQWNLCCRKFVWSQAFVFFSISPVCITFKMLSESVRRFSKEDIQMANRLKKHSKPSIRGVWMKATMRYCPVPARTAALRKNKDNKGLGGT